jgi:hypothetical protein
MGLVQRPFTSGRPEPRTTAARKGDFCPGALPAQVNLKRLTTLSNFLDQVYHILIWRTVAINLDAMSSYIGEVQKS